MHVYVYVLCIMYVYIYTCYQMLSTKTKTHWFAKYNGTVPNFSIEADSGEFDDKKKGKNVRTHNVFFF